jgi:hypothetical protein
MHAPSFLESSSRLPALALALAVGRRNVAEALAHHERQHHAAVFVLEDEGFEGVAEPGCQSSNLATLTPRAFASRVSIPTVGSEPPVSSFRRYSRETPAAFASAYWLKPLALRSCLSLIPICLGVVIVNYN